MKHKNIAAPEGHAKARLHSKDTESLVGEAAAVSPHWVTDGASPMQQKGIAAHVGQARAGQQKWGVTLSTPRWARQRQ